MGSTFVKCDREKYKEICSKVLRKPKYVCFASFPLQSRLNILYVMLLEISIKKAQCDMCLKWLGWQRLYSKNVRVTETRALKMRELQKSEL